MPSEAAHVGVLVLRIGAGLLLWNYHVLHKLPELHERVLDFPDPLGVGAHASLLLAIASEGLCSVLVAAGLLTRLAALPVIFAMSSVLLLAARGFAGADTQTALLYGLVYAAIALVGPGALSLDHWLRSRYERLTEPVRRIAQRVLG